MKIDCLILHRQGSQPEQGTPRGQVFLSGSARSHKAKGMQPKEKWARRKIDLLAPWSQFESVMPSSALTSSGIRGADFSFSSQEPLEF